MQTSGDNILITVKDITVCYDDNGKGEIPVIFIHGFPFDKSSWQPQLDYLGDMQRVIAYDLRGFGRSTAGDEKPSMVVFADDLINFMDALQIGKAIVCGLSMGGYILLNAVNRYPERFEAIILSDTQCIIDSEEAKKKRYSSIEQIEAGKIDDFVSGFLNAAFCKETLENKPGLVEKIKTIILSNPPATITATITALANRWEMCSTLNEISVPALILCGREDVITPPAQSDYLSTHIKDSVFHFIEKAGHLSNLENEEEFNKYLREFVMGLRRKE